MDKQETESTMKIFDRSKRHFGIFPYWISWLWCRRTTCTFYRRKYLRTIGLGKYLKHDRWESDYE